MFFGIVGRLASLLLSFWRFGSDLVCFLAVSGVRYAIFPSEDLSERTGVHFGQHWPAGETRLRFTSFVES